MSTVTGAEVWAKICEDPSFKVTPLEVQNAMRPFFEASPGVLTELLDKPATFENLLEAKSLYMHYALNNGFFETAVLAVAEPTLGSDDRNALALMLATHGLKLLAKFDQYAANIKEALKSRMVTSDEFMRGSSVGLNPETRALYQSGSLTIGDILRLQPTVILKNNDE